MDTRLENMDETYSQLSKLANWVHRNSLPPIPFADRVGYGRYHNPPAPHLEISFVISGQYNDFRIGDRTVQLSPNTVTLHNVHFGNYSSKAEGLHHCGWCVFLNIEGIDELSYMGKSPLFCPMPVIHPERLLLAFKTLAGRCRIPGHPHPGYLTGTNAYDPADEEHSTPVRQLRIKAALLELLAILLDNAQSLKNPEPQRLDVVRLGIDFITEHYARHDLTLENIAESVQLSDDYFGMLFRRHVGTTPMRYLKTVRIAQSKLLLRKMQLPIAEIASRVGFGDPLHFSRVFRQETGTSPRQFRQRVSAV